MDIIKEINEEWVNIREGRSTFESSFSQALMTNIIKKKSFSFHEETYTDKIIKVNRADIIVGVRMTEANNNGTTKKGTLNFKINGDLIGSTEMESFQCAGIPGIKSIISGLWFTHQSIEIEVEKWNGHVSIIYAVLDTDISRARSNVASLMNTIAIPLEDKTKVLVKNGDMYEKVDIVDNTKQILPALPLREPDEVYPQISWRNGDKYGRYKMSQK